MESWVFLLVGGLGAVGAALSLGTLAAWIRYERTGEVPGHEATAEGDDGDDGGGEDGQDVGDRAPAVETVPPSGRSVRRRLLTRIVIGAVVAAVCVVILAEQGLLAGPVLG